MALARGACEDQATALQSLSAAHLANNNAKQALEAPQVRASVCRKGNRPKAADWKEQSLRST